MEGILAFSPKFQISHKEFLIVAWPLDKLGMKPHEHVPNMEQGDSNFVASGSATAPALSRGLQLLEILDAAPQGLNLTPSPPADARTLLRRVYYDLHALAALCRVLINSNEFLFVNSTQES